MIVKQSSTSFIIAPMPLTKLPPNFQKAIKKLKSLKDHPQYTAGLIFGSTARGEITKNSDIDVILVTNSAKLCDNVSHPLLEGIKVDISFTNFSKLKQRNEEEIASAKRIPILAECIILFDKTGELHQLKKIAQKTKPKLLSKSKHQWIQFMILHATDKAKRHLKSDPLSSIYSLHSNIGEILKFHYQINRRWWVSDKRLIKDIETWDKKLHLFLISFLTSHKVDQKFSFWEKITGHILKPIGGPRKITEINCTCSICQKHLKKINT